MKVVFLDIDGVLNSSAFFKACEGRPEPKDDDEMTRGMIDPAAVELLNEIIEKSGAEIVISSTWRRAFSPGMIARALHHNGFKHHRALIARTPHIAGERGHEIAAWLAQQQPQNVEAFVILDDDSDMAHLIERLVQTDTRVGLQREHVARALEMLAAVKEVAGG